jgi:hypothetical protein
MPVGVGFFDVANESDASALGTNVPVSRQVVSPKYIQCPHIEEFKWNILLYRFWSLLKDA